MIQVKALAIPRSPTFWAWFSMVVRSAVPFAILAYSQTALDAQNAFVAWLALSMTAIALLFDSGLTPTFTRYFASRGLSSDGYRLQSTDDDIAGLYRYCSSLYVNPTLILLCSTFVLTLIFLLNDLGSATEQSLKAFMLALIMASSFYVNKYKSPLIGLGSIVAVKRVEAASGLSTLILITLTILTDGGVIEILSSILFGRLMDLFVLQNYCNKFNQSLTEKQLPAPLKSEIKLSIFRSMIGVMATAGTIEGTAIVAAKLVGEESAVQYLICLRFAVMLSAFSYVPFQVKIPHLVTLFRDKKLNELSLSLQQLRLYTFTVLVAGGASMLIISVVMEKLAGIVLPFSHTNYWPLLICYFAYERLGAINVQVQTLNHVVNWHTINLISGLFMFATCLVFFPLFQLMGFSLAFVAVGCLVYYPWSISLKRSVLSERKLIDLVWWLIPLGIYFLLENFLRGLLL